MGILELEWIDIGDGSNGRSMQKQAERRKPSADRQLRNKKEGHQMPAEEIQRQRVAAGRRQRMEDSEPQRRMSVNNRLEPPILTEKASTQAGSIPAPNGRTRRKKRRRQIIIIKSILLAATFLTVTGVLFGIAILGNYMYGQRNKEAEAQTAAKILVEEQDIPQDIREWGAFYATQLERPELAVDLLTINEYSRPGEALPEVKNIFVHYTANVGTTAEQNKSYFQSLAETHERSASAHFIIGYNGVIVQCIPTAEIAYAVKERNYDSISIECCFLDESGEFTQATYDSLIELTAWLLHKYELKPEDVLRHYDEGGKNCPKYYVEHEDAWWQFLRDLADYMARVTVAG